MKKQVTGGMYLFSSRSQQRYFDILIHIFILVFLKKTCQTVGFLKFSFPVLSFLQATKNLGHLLLDTGYVKLKYAFILSLPIFLLMTFQSTGKYCLAYTHNADLLLLKSVANVVCILKIVSLLHIAKVLLYCKWTPAS